MGYCISMEESTIVIKKENADKVVEALSKLAQSKTRLAWIDVDVLIESESIEESFEEIRYELQTNENGDYEIDYFSGEKLGNDFEVFKTIAPFVEDGYIEMYGEDGCSWRWVFKNGECKEIYPTITWKE